MTVGRKGRDRPESTVGPKERNRKMAIHQDVSRAGQPERAGSRCGKRSTSSPSYSPSLSLDCDRNPGSDSHPSCSVQRAPEPENSFRLACPAQTPRPLLPRATPSFSVVVTVFEFWRSVLVPYILSCVGCLIFVRRCFCVLVRLRQRTSRARCVGWASKISHLYLY